MEKNNIPQPSPILFTAKIPVQINHINFGNHVGFDNMISLIHEAQVQFFAHYGYSEIDVEKTYLVVHKLEVVYKKEAFYGEILNFGIGLGEVTPSRLNLLFSVSNAKNEEITRAKTTLVFIDHVSKKIVSPPKQFMDSQ